MPTSGGDRAELALREGHPLAVGLLPRLVVGGLLIVVVETVMVVLLKTHP
ncbi:MAG: hypothetical protein L0H64_01960 [Pseudonocardia sp.]|nr:hypothetical protein [Pseudonocardia sp.]